MSVQSLLCVEVWRNRLTVLNSFSQEKFYIANRTFDYQKSGGKFRENISSKDDKLPPNASLPRGDFTSLRWPIAYKVRSVIYCCFSVTMFRWKHITDRVQLVIFRSSKVVKSHTFSISTSFCFGLSGLYILQPCTRKQFKRSGKLDLFVFKKCHDVSINL